MTAAGRVGHRGQYDRKTCYNDVYMLLLLLSITCVQRRTQHTYHIDPCSSGPRAMLSILGAHRGQSQYGPAGLDS